MLVLTRSKLRQWCERQWGSAWIEVLAFKLACARRTVARWDSGENTLPRDLKDRLLLMIDEELALLAEFKSELEHS
jgi:hypothetical protein